jgi:hypothetical protein
MENEKLRSEELSRIENKKSGLRKKMQRKKSTKKVILKELTKNFKSNYQNKIQSKCFTRKKRNTSGDS